MLDFCVPCVKITIIGTRLLFSFLKNSSNHLISLLSKVLFEATFIQYQIQCIVSLISFEVYPLLIIDKISFFIASCWELDNSKPGVSYIAKDNHFFQFF